MNSDDISCNNGSFFEYFNRPCQHCDIDRYSDRLGDTLRRGRDNIGGKLQTLFSDAFDHHVEFNLDTPPDIQFLYNDSRRIVSADSMTSYFIDEIYVPPLIFEQTNSRLNKDNVVPFDDFF